MGQTGTHGSSAMIRQVVLVILLIAAAAAALYDFKVARPAAQNAYNKISELSAQPAPLNSQDVQKALGKKPSQVLSGENSYVEKYSWLSGLLVKSHYIWVVYGPQKPHLFQVHYLNQPVDLQMQHNYKAAAVRASSVPPTPGRVGSTGDGGNSTEASGATNQPGTAQEITGAPPSSGAAETTSPSATP